MRAGRVVALVIGSLLVVPAIALLVGGGAVLVAHAVARDDDGYFSVEIDRLESETVAVTAEDVGFFADGEPADWFLDWLDLDVRLRATPVDADQELFLGIAREADVDEYLAGTAHDELTDVDGRRPVLRGRTGGADVAPPVDQDFWTVSSTGVGTQEVRWEATGGDWAAVLMNADGSATVAADVDVGAWSGLVLPVGITLLVVGLVLTAAAVVLIVVGANGAAPLDRGRLDPGAPSVPPDGGGPATAFEPPEPPEPPEPVGAGRRATGSPDVSAGTGAPRGGP